MPGEAIQAYRIGGISILFYHAPYPGAKHFFLATDQNGIWPAKLSLFHFSNNLKEVQTVPRRIQFRIVV